MKGFWVQIKFNDGTYTQVHVSGIEEIESVFGFDNIKLISKLDSIESVV